MRFIGSKKLLLKNIDYVIQHNIKDRDKLNIFCDIFSGTSVVAQYFKDRYQIISNDLMYFSYCIQNTYIKLNKKPSFKKLNLGKSIGNYFNAFEKTNESGFIYRNYAPSKGSQRKYLSKTNSAKIDNVRQLCNKWLKEKKINFDEYLYLVCMIVEAVPFISNIAGTYGAYLKNWDNRSFKDINFIEPEIVSNQKKNYCYNEDANTLINKIKGDILYLDPPYNSRQYLPNYHLLETIAKYDNPKIKGKTGIRDYSNQKSLYCIKKEAENSLEDLIKNAKFKYILLSYNSEGIIPEKNLEGIFKRYSNKLYKKYKFPYRRYKKDKKEHKDQLYEMIFIMDKKII